MKQTIVTHPPPRYRILNGNKCLRYSFEGVKVPKRWRELSGSILAAMDERFYELTVRVSIKERNSILIPIILCKFPVYPFVIIALCIKIYLHVHIELCNIKRRQGKRRGRGREEKGRDEEDKREDDCRVIEKGEKRSRGGKERGATCLLSPRSVIAVASLKLSLGMH